MSKPVLVWSSFLFALLTYKPNISISLDEMYYGPQPNVYNGRYKKVYYRTSVKSAEGKF